MNPTVEKKDYSPGTLKRRIENSDDILIIKRKKVDDYESFESNLLGFDVVWSSVKDKSFMSQLNKDVSFALVT